MYISFLLKTVYKIRKQISSPICFNTLYINDHNGIFMSVTSEQFINKYIFKTFEKSFGDEENVFDLMRINDPAKSSRYKYN